LTLGAGNSTKRAIGTSTIVTRRGGRHHPHCTAFHPSLVTAIVHRPGRSSTFKRSNVPTFQRQSFHPSTVELFLEKTKIQRTIEEQILLPPNMAQLGQRPSHIWLFQPSSLAVFHPQWSVFGNLQSTINNPRICSSKKLIQITKRNKSSCPHICPYSANTPHI
jgi:hypothetical protein